MVLISIPLAFTQISEEKTSVSVLKFLGTTLFLGYVFTVGRVFAYLMVRYLALKPQFRAAQVAFTLR